jgi:hypothetical protein
MNADIAVLGPEGAAADVRMPGHATEPPVNDGEASMILKFEKRIAPPEDIRREMERWEDIRRYVHTDAMLLDEEDAVGTNFIYRNQRAILPRISPKDPSPSIAPMPKMPAREQIGPDGMPMPAPVGQDHQQMLIDYARTHELLIRFQQRKSGLVEIVEGAAQDALTLPIAWIKMRFQEDFELDPVGYGRNNDQLDLVKRYERLRRDFTAGLFTKDSAEAAEMGKLDATVRAYLLGEMRNQLEASMQPVARPLGGYELDPLTGEPVMAGDEAVEAQIQALLAGADAGGLEGLVDMSLLPEVAHYRGYTFQQVDAEDVRWDWNIRRPEDLRYARWMAHRVWMTDADIREKWNVTEDQLRNAQRFSHDGYKTVLRDSSDEDPEYGGKDLEEQDRSAGGAAEDPQRRGTLLAVWEYWDRVQGRVFRWVQGSGRLLDCFVPRTNPSQFFPFFGLQFDRVTGRFIGICTTDLQAPLQDESNRIRTWQREAQKASHPKFITSRGLMRPGEKRKLAEGLPYSITEVEAADELKDRIFPIIPAVYNPALYDRSDTISEMQQMAGVPNAALGAGNKGLTATSDAITNEQMGAQADDRATAIDRVYAAIYLAMAEINAQAMPEENVRAIAGDGAVWPVLDRQTILAGMVVTIDANRDDKQARSVELAAWKDIVGIAQVLGLPLDPIAVTAKLMRLMDVRDNIGNYISIPGLLQTMGVPATAGGGSAAPAAGSAPSDQGPAGKEGGAPPGKGLDKPPSPDSVPNRPPPSAA